MAQKALGVVKAGRLLIGTGEPSPNLGLNDDSYIDTDTRTFYIKEFNTWVDQWVFSESAMDLETKIDISEKAKANGVATLDTNAKIPLVQLPDGFVRHVYLTQSEYDQLQDPDTDTEYNIVED